MALVTRANREHSTAVEAILKALTEIRDVTDRNVRGAQESRRATDGLRERTAALATIADSLGRGQTPTRRRNGGRR